MKKITSLVLLFTLFASITNAQTLDQSQLIYNAGTSARTLVGYSIFQSFTAGLTGTLVQIDMGVFNYINGAGTLKIYAGGNNLGTLLQTIPVTINCPTGNCFASFTTLVPMTAGQVYTFHFIPGAGIPDPYGVQMQVPGTYSGGQFGLIDPSGTSYPGFDMIFRTYVNTNLGLVTTAPCTATIYPNPVVSSFTLQNPDSFAHAEAVLYNIYGQQVKQWSNLCGQTVTLNRDTVASGVYVLQVTQDQKLLVTQKLVLTN